MRSQEEIVAVATLARQTLCDTTKLEQEKAFLGQELVLVEMTQNCIAENARVAQDKGVPDKAMQQSPYGEAACIIGETTGQAAGQVALRTAIGGLRVVDMPLGNLVPRIC